MKRTQIYIPEDIHKEAKAVAKEENRSLSDLFREFIARGLNNKKSSKKEGGLSELAELNISGGPKDLSEKMDSYLYNPKKE